jgi:hypothetical protein
MSPESNGYIIGCIISEQPVFDKAIKATKLKLKTPKDWSYDQIKKRTFGLCCELMRKGKFSTFEIENDGKSYQCYLYLLNSDQIEELKEIIAKKSSEIELDEQNIDDVELYITKNFEAFKNLLDIWINCKFYELFKRDFEAQRRLWILKESDDYRIRFGAKAEFTPEGRIILWIEISKAVRYTLADYINNYIINRSSEELTFQEILKNRDKYFDLLQEIYEIIKKEFIGKNINCVMFSENYGWYTTKGKIVDVIPNWTDKYEIKTNNENEKNKPRLSGQTQLTDFGNNITTLYDYILQRNKKAEKFKFEKRDYIPEYPVVRVQTYKKSILNPLDFTPSDVLISYRDDVLCLSPNDRFGYTDEVATKIIKDLKLDFPFLDKPIGFKPYLPDIFKDGKVNLNSIRLETKNNNGFKPIKILSTGGEPLGGKINLFLIYITPAIKKVQELVELKHNVIAQKFKEHNLGEIIGYDVVTYKYYPDDPNKTTLSVGEAIRKAIQKYKNFKYPTLPVVVGIQKGDYFEEVKRIATQHEKHSKVVLLETLREFTENSVNSAIFACNLYIETLIQENIDRLDELDGLIWKLEKPADGKGETVYIGFDYSRDIEGRGCGIFTFLCDSYGRLIHAKKAYSPNEYITEKDAWRLFSTLIPKAQEYAKKKGLPEPSRIVFYRDGYFKSYWEVKNILNGFIKYVNASGTDIHLDIVEVIKNCGKRIFKMSTEGISNPDYGYYVVLPKFGYAISRALVCSSKPNGKSTTAPIELRYIAYDEQTAIDRLVWEFLALSKLDFWSPITHPKLCLPVLLAHKLSNLARMGIDLRFPK